jgi:hypothetical protein
MVSFASQSNNSPGIAGAHGIVQTTLGVATTALAQGPFVGGLHDALFGARCVAIIFGATIFVRNPNCHHDADEIQDDSESGLSRSP